MQSIRQLTRYFSCLAFLALVALHVWVLGRRLADGALFEPGVAIRWLGTAALVVAAFWLKRQGISLLRGRSAAIFWLTVIFLHAGAPAPLTEFGAMAQQLPQELIVLFSLPIGLRWLESRLDVRAIAQRGLRPGRAQSLIPRALSLVGHYPPAWRRPPPF